jgi:hypothetical protein
MEPGGWNVILEKKIFTSDRVDGKKPKPTLCHASGWMRKNL